MGEQGEGKITNLKGAQTVILCEKAAEQHPDVVHTAAGAGDAALSWLRRAAGQCATTSRHDVGGAGHVKVALWALSGFACRQLAGVCHALAWEEAISLPRTPTRARNTTYVLYGYISVSIYRHKYIKLLIFLSC